MSDKPAYGEYDGDYYLNRATDPPMPGESISAKRKVNSSFLAAMRDVHREKDRMKRWVDWARETKQYDLYESLRACWAGKEPPRVR